MARPTIIAPLLVLSAWCFASSLIKSLTYTQWRFYVGARGHRPPQILPRPPKFLDTVVLLLVELIGSIVISLKFHLTVVASQMMRGQAPQIFFLEPPLSRQLFNTLIPRWRTVNSIAYTLFVWSRLSEPVIVDPLYHSRHNCRDRQYECDRRII